MQNDDIIKLFTLGFDCGQVVLLNFLKDFNLTREQALKLTSCFGGGSFKGKTCGAINGSLVVLGLKYGHFNENDFKTKEKIEEITKYFFLLFEEKYGSSECKSLLKHDINNKEELQIILNEGLLFTLCPNIVKDSIFFIKEIFKKYK